MLIGADLNDDGGIDAKDLALMRAYLANGDESIFGKTSY